jgi:hypothetical protein
MAIRADTGMNRTATDLNSTAKLSAAVNILLGAWLFVSPWVYGAAGNGNAWNSWIVGAIIAIFAAIRYSSPAGASVLRRINMILAIWVFASPWIYGYTGNTGRFINSLCVGVAVFIVSIVGTNLRHSNFTNVPIQH